MYRGKHLKGNMKRKPQRREIPNKSNEVITVKRPKDRLDSIINEVKSWSD